MNTFAEQPLRLLLANDSSIHIRRRKDQAAPHLIVVHVPWPSTSVASADDVEWPMDDDLVHATWEDAEWQ